MYCMPTHSHSLFNLQCPFLASTLPKMPFNILRGPTIPPLIQCGQTISADRQQVAMERSWFTICLSLSYKGTPSFPSLLYIHIYTIYFSLYQPWLQQLPAF